MRLLAIDLSNLIVRHSSNPYGSDTDAAGRPVHGAIGALAQIARTIGNSNPTHLLIARDCRRADSFRRKLDPGYKAHRSESDEEIKHQFKTTMRGIEILGWPLLGIDGYEADDILASGATLFNGQTDILTGDRDMLALCSDKVTVLLLRPGGEVPVDSSGCFSLMGVRPDQLTDYKALVGDSSDGILGIRGVGPKSAERLLDKYDNLDNVYKRVKDNQPLEGISEAIAKKVAEGKEQAELSYLLAKLVCDLPIDFDALIVPGVYDDDLVGPDLERIGLGPLRSKLGSKVSRKSSDLDIEDHFKNMFN